MVENAEGRSHRVSLIALEGPEPQAGDWLVVHSGYALRRVDSEQAAAIVSELRAGQEALS
jgi:hydrogenase maturation factor